MRHAGVSSVIVGALAAAAVAVPSSAHPPAPVDESGHAIRGKLHTWLHQAKVPLVRGRVQIRRVRCPLNTSLAGCVYTARPRTLYLSPGIHEPRRTFYHELGHVFDLRVLNARERRRFKRIVGIHRGGWFHDGLPPAEWFADGYASCAMRPRLHRRLRPTPYGYAATPRRHARVCRLIRAAARRHGRPPKRPDNPPRVIEVPPPPPQETQPGQGGCTMVDQLLTGCRPPAPPPPPPLPVRALP
jgi:hypothetical protein